MKFQGNEWQYSTTSINLKTSMVQAENKRMPYWPGTEQSFFLAQKEHLEGSTLKNDENMEVAMKEQKNCMHVLYWYIIHTEDKWSLEDICLVNLVPDHL
jgi:hypothetical protein